MGDNRAWIRWLPALVGLLWIHRPLLRHINSGLGFLRKDEKLERRSQRPRLHLGIVDHAEAMPKGELNAKSPGGPVLVGEHRHHGDGHRWNPCGFNDTCQHGHVLATIRSGRSEDECIDIDGVAAGGDLGPDLRLPHLGALLLVPHQRVMLRRSRTHDPSVDEFVQPLDRKGNVHVLEEVGGIDVEVADIDLLL